MTNKKIIYTGLFASLIIIGAQLKISNPIVPFTLQFLFVALAGLILGAKYGAMSVIIYLCLGLAGLPVFANGGGISYIAKPTFGYLAGFIVCAFITGLISFKLKPSVTCYFTASIIGLVILHIIGIPYLYLSLKYIQHSTVSFINVFKACVITMPADIFLSFIAAYIAVRLKNILGSRL